MNKTVVKVDDNTELELTNVISLKQFPPSLRKLAKYILQTKHLPELITEIV